MTTALHKPRRTTKALAKEPELVVDREKKPAWLPTLKVVSIKPLQLSSQELITCLEKDKAGVTIASLAGFRSKLWLTPSDLNKLIDRLTAFSAQMKTKIAHLDGRHIVYVLGRGTFSDSEIEDGAIEEVLNYRGDYYDTLDEARNARELLPAEPKQYVYKVLVKNGSITKMVHAEPERTPKPESKKVATKSTRKAPVKPTSKGVGLLKKPAKKLLH